VRAKGSEQGIQTLAKIRSIVQRSALLDGGIGLVHIKSGGISDELYTVKVASLNGPLELLNSGHLIDKFVCVRAGKRVWIGYCGCDDEGWWIVGYVALIMGGPGNYILFVVIYYINESKLVQSR